MHVVPFNRTRYSGLRAAIEEDIWKLCRYVVTSPHLGFFDDLADFQRPFTQKSAKMWPQIVFLLEYIAGVGLCIYASVVVGVIAFYVTLEKGAPFWEICGTKVVELYQVIIIITTITITTLLYYTATFYPHSQPELTLPILSVIPI